MNGLWIANRRCVSVVLLLLFAVAGCESGIKLYPVRGTVTLEDGTPLAKGMVIFESKDAESRLTARGEVASDGSYQLSTHKPGDGVPPGKYRVHINPLNLSEVSDEEKNLPYDRKYTNVETSGLEYEVKPEPNGFSIRLLRVLRSRSNGQWPYPEKDKRMHSTLSNGRALLPTALLIALSTAGCGSRLYPVRGTVSLEDGTPLTKGMVIFESDQEGAIVMARGEIKPDGTYELCTHRPGDGVPPGKYHVHIKSGDLSEVSDEKKNLPFDVKYTKFATSGLEFEVKPGPNEYEIKLARPRKGRR
jgi:hypothetical protein